MRDRASNLGLRKEGRPKKKKANEPRNEKPFGDYHHVLGLQDICHYELA